MTPLSSLLSPLLHMLLVLAGVAQQHPHQSYHYEDNVKSMNMTLLPNPTSINIIWDAVDNSTVYNIEWSEVNEIGKSNHSTDAEFYTINELLPCTDYFVSVQAMQDELQLDKENSTTQTTPQASFPVTNLKVTQVDGDATLEVTWAPVTPPGNCELTYIVTWSSYNTSEAGQTNTTEPHYTITGLTYNIEYNVCVVPWVEGESALHKECKNETIVTSVPGGPPENIMVVTTTSDSIELKWDPPAAPNGVIANYSVTWNPNNGTADTTNPTYTLTGLLPCTTYTVTVSAATSKGYGPRGNTSDATKAVVLEAPRNLMETNHTQTVITVSWKAPPVKPNCFLKNYQISWDQSNDTVTLLPNINEYSITHLNPGTKYVIFVAAENEAGVGKPDTTEASTAPSGSQSQANVGAIVGGVIGGLVLVALVVAAVVKRNTLKKMVKRAKDKGGSYGSNTSSSTKIHE